MQTIPKTPDDDGYRAALAAIRRHLALTVMAVEALEAVIDRKEGRQPKVQARKNWRLEVAGWCKRKAPRPAAQ
jgi:hypothetical protein